MATRQKAERAMTAAEFREQCRKYLPEVLKGLAEMAETSDSEKIRKDAARALTSRGYVRTAKRKGDVLNVTWRLKK